MRLQNISSQMLQNMQKPIQTKVEIIEKFAINHDCYVYKLKFAGEPFVLNIGQYFKITQTIKTAEYPQGETVTRKYTPISPCSQKDMDILIKIYRPNVNPNFPNGGKMTPYLQTLKVGDTINVEGPFGRFGYEPNGTIIVDGQKIPMKKIFFIAGGSGITPVYQTIMEIVKMKEQKIQMILLFANKSEQDIVLRKELESLGDRVKLHYIVDKGDQNWKGLTGYVNDQLLNKICPLNEKDTMYIHCGPGPMNQAIRTLFSQKYPQSRLFKY